MKAVIRLFVLWLMLPCFCLPVQAARVVRVGFPAQDGLSEIAADGTRSGYTYEYLQELAQYTGWTYEFITPEGDNAHEQLLEMLQNGEIDLLGGMEQTDELSALFDFPSSSYGASYTLLLTRTDNAALNESNYQTLEGARVGLLDGAGIQNDAFDRFCQANRLTIERVFFPDAGAQQDALFSGQVDAIVCSDQHIPPYTRIIAKFDPRPFFFATTKGNVSLIRTLDASLSQLSSIDPSYAATLYEDFFGNEENARLLLSDDDQQYIAGLDRPLRVGVRPGYIPFQYLDENGKLRGIAYELFNYISDKTGLQFEFIVLEDAGSSVDLTQNPNIDLLAAAAVDYDEAAQNGFSLTRPYAVSQVVMAQRASFDSMASDRLRLAVPQTVDYADTRSGQLLYYPTFQACLDAVCNGEADVTHNNAYSMQYYVSQPRYRSLKLISLSDQYYKVGIGVSKSCDARLLPILNKTLLSIPDSDLQSIIYNGTLVHTPPTLTALIETHPLQAVLVVLAAALLLLLGIGVLTRQRLLAGRRLALENTRYHQLSEISGEYLFEYSYADDCLTLTERSAAVLHTAPVLEGFAVTLKLESKTDPRFAPVLQYGEALTRTHEAVSELHCCLPGGIARWLRVTAKVIADEAGQPLYAIGKFADVQAAREEREALIQQAQRDSLTGIYNAATARTRVSELLHNLHEGDHGAFIIMDIDYFKQVNDTFGHIVGDQVLTETAKVLQTVFRKEDIVSRLGGDEFLVYLPRGVQHSLLKDKCALLQCAIHENVRPAEGVSVSLSIGAAMSHAGQTFDALYRSADQALYAVKRGGRGAYQIATHDMKG